MLLRLHGIDLVLTEIFIKVISFKKFHILFIFMWLAEFSVSNANLLWKTMSIGKTEVLR